MKKTCAVILAAGNSIQMNSKYPKALCGVLFKPMINWVIDWCDKAGINEICVVLGDENNGIKNVLPSYCITVTQSEPKGTGHAVMMTKNFLNEHIDYDVIILCADTPFISDKILIESFEEHKKTNADITVISAQTDNPSGYGRLVCENSEPQNLLEIIEQKDISPNISLLKQVNSGAYWFNCKFLISAINQMTLDNKKQEYPLTDTIKIAVSYKKKVSIYYSLDESCILGANNRADLLKLNMVASKIVVDRLLLDGVNFYCIDGIVISPDAKIGRDTTIAPGTIIKSNVTIGEDCVIGPNSVIENSCIGNNCVIDSSLIENSTVGNGVRIGPNSHLRPNCVIADDVKIGNFVEVKNSTLGEKSSVAHLTYVGDTDMGSYVNMGGGCITVNYNGYHKYRTTIEDNAFIGCNTNLVAPVTIKNGAFTAAGSTIYSNVESNSLAIARARQVNKDGWALEHKKQNQD